MVWVGRGARHARPQILALLDAGFGTVSGWAGHGIVPDDHPQNIGILNGPGSPAVEDLYKEVDLLLVVGSRIRGHETLDQTCPLPQNLVHIDIDPLADGRTYPNVQLICGDSVAVLDRLIANLNTPLGIDPQFKSRISAVKGGSIIRLSVHAWALHGLPFAVARGNASPNSMGSRHYVEQ